MHRDVDRVEHDERVVAEAVKTVEVVDHGVEIEVGGEVLPEQIQLLNPERPDAEVDDLDLLVAVLIEEPLQVGGEVLAGGRLRAHDERTTEDADSHSAGGFLPINEGVGVRGSRARPMRHSELGDLMTAKQWERLLCKAFLNGHVVPVERSHPPPVPHCVRGHERERHDRDDNRTANDRMAPEY